MFQDDDEKVQNELTNGFESSNIDELKEEENADTFQERCNITDQDEYNLIVQVFYFP